MTMFLISDDYWEVKNTKDKGRGIFCKKEIKEGTVIGDYLGKVVKISETTFNNATDEIYLMYFTDDACIEPDQKKIDIHLINNSCTPNCWFYTYKGHTLFFAIKNIKPGEELTISYLLSPKDELCNPCTHICKCEHSKCTGTFHLTKDKYTLWQDFQERKNKNMKIETYIIGENLSKLTSYPKKIRIDPIYSSLLLDG